VRNGVEGTGLGLSIVDAVMNAHGGEVRVQSELGKGATFTLFFPIQEM
jgi:two-component system OmpR family sensor kinase